MKIRTKITLVYVTLSMVIVVAVGVVSSFEVEKYFQTRLLEDLSRTASAVDFFVTEQKPAFPEVLDRQIKHLASLQQIRITLIDKTGRVLADSDVPLDQLSSVENHLLRPEVQQALGQSVGSQVRHSATVGQDFLYLAKKVGNSDRGRALADLAFVRVSVHLEALRETVREIRLGIALAGVLVLAVILVVNVAVSARIARPMVEIARSASEIRAGNLEKRIEVRSKDEIGQVAQAVNDLVDKLNADIVRLKKLEQFRSEFLGNVSHELRTPIFSLQGFLETLAEGAIDDPSVNRSFLQKAREHSARLDALLEDLINISQIESGEMKMSFRYFLIGELLESVVQEAQAEAEKRRVRLHLKSLPPGETRVYGDKERLRQVLQNLLDNAIKYNKVSGEVAVSAVEDDGRVHVTVTDTGVGISKEHVPRIFERFYRVDKNRSRDVGGTGLGLAIVKHIIEAHHSRVEVHGEPGKGSSFSFFLKK